jgi:SPP1 family predicted phage head-tail adaptor
VIKVNIGELKHRITFQRLATSINDNGFEVKTWEPFKIVWAKVENLHGREYFTAAQVKAERTVKFTIRYIEGIDETMKILFKDKVYNITFIDNIKYENRFVEIKALEVEGDIDG